MQHNGSIFSYRWVKANLFMLNISISNLAMQTQEIERILQKYPYISKYYGQYVTSFINKGHRLINLVINNRGYLDLLNGLLEKLDSHPDISHLVKKSKNPEDFLNIMSEFKVASLLIDKVGKDKLTIILPRNSSPDFEIEIFGEKITIEVKNIEDKRETLKGKVIVDVIIN